MSSASVSALESRVVRHALHVPSQQQIADLFNANLSEFFADVSCSVVPCPDLRSAPFHLAHHGLSGRQAVCDVSLALSSEQLALATLDSTDSLVRRLEACLTSCRWPRRTRSTP